MDSHAFIVQNFLLVYEEFVLMLCRTENHGFVCTGNASRGIEVEVILPGNVLLAMP